MAQPPVRGRRPPIELVAAGYASRAEITLLADGGVRVADDAQGIAFEDADDAGGVGLDRLLTQLYGVPVASPTELVNAAPLAGSGTTITFWPDLESPRFEGCTKGELGNAEVRDRVRDAVAEHLEKWLVEHPREAAAVLDHILRKAPRDELNPPPSPVRSRPPRSSPGRTMA